MEGKKILQSYIGKNVVITSAPNASIIGRCGVIVDETKYSFVIHANGQKIIRILKKSATFMIGGVVIDGNTIVKRPEERIKSRGK
ncbi:MAG: ribonuclease P protein subunit [Nanoarchaeota archaeon]